MTDGLFLVGVALAVLVAIGMVALVVLVGRESEERPR